VTYVALHFGKPFAFSGAGVKEDEIEIFGFDAAGRRFRVRRIALVI
jgi:hypothetical protein